MIEFTDGKDVYGVQYINKLLTNRYQDNIFFCCEPAGENILYFKQMANYLINTKYRERGITTEELLEQKWEKRNIKTISILNQVKLKH